jgi:hypothetical protein
MGAILPFQALDAGLMSVNDLPARALAPPQQFGLLDQRQIREIHVFLRQKTTLARADSSSRASGSDRKIHPPVASVDCRRARRGCTIQMTLRHLTRYFDFNNGTPFGLLTRRPG